MTTSDSRLDAAASLRALLVAIDEGDVEATSDERAYLAGSVDALERVGDLMADG